MDASAKKILSELKKGKYAPVYLLQGEETYYIDLISNHIEENCLSESERGFNQVVVYGKETPMHVILNHARRFPMMAERQVVIVREAQDIQDLQKEAGAKMLLDYLTKPSPTTVLVLCHKHKTLDKRKELGKKADQLAVSLTFKKPYDSQLMEFISGYLEEKGFEMEDRGIQLLSEYVGNDLKRLSNEIDKLLTQTTKDSVISAESVMSTVGVSREYNIFELQKAIITKNHLQATKIANYFANNTRKNPLLPMIAFFYSFFSKLLIASSSPQQDEKNLVSILKISPYAIKDYSNALRNYSGQKIAQNIHHIKSADLKLKGVSAGSETEGQILKELIFQLMYTQ